MQRWKKAVLWTTGSIFGALAAGVALILSVAPATGPSKGPKIPEYATPRTALLVVDLQEDYTGPQAKQPYRDADRIVSFANGLLASAQAKGILVVHIKNEIANPILKLLVGGINAPGEPGTEMDRRLLQVPGAKTFTKRNSDAFSNPEFDAFLRANQVNQVLITGLDGAMCVDATARGALGRGYAVTMFTGGIAIHGRVPMEALARGWREAGAVIKWAPGSF
ncbi:isochorismatase family cysteine hydrolase [Geothrix sp. 21YS21S-2]|uniref:isochorismatase family cysteine hydrolase n=1 Tax=Geothrix sp. 21YS21S-2 TaxID=3068893 RepID=UPI0027BA83FF|nr:isochorismatase family cysteine hydrolase [Geothrix sp. 21YS21S-2]